MLVGYHWLSDDEAPTLYPASTFLDVAGARPGMLSAERLVRIYFKGRPDPRLIAHRALGWHAQGCRVVPANEPNLPLEEWGSDDPGTLRAWFAEVKRHAPGVRLYWPAPSPGAPGWEAWYDGADAAHGITVHAYGELEQMVATVDYVADLYPGKPLWVGEWNFGAGRSVDVDDWARRTVGPFLDHCRTRGVEAASYFAWTWPTPDTAGPVAVDARGTAVEREIARWHARAGHSQPAPVDAEPPEIANLPAPPAETTQESPMATLEGIDCSNHQGHIDWDAVAASGIAFAFIKSSGDEGGDNRFFDPWFRRNWSEARRVGIVRGAYHYARPSVVGYAVSVRLFREAIDAAGGLESGDLIALDLEDPDVAVGSDLTNWVDGWLNLAEETLGVEPVLYTGNYYIRERGVRPVGAVGGVPLWLASYQSEPPPPPDGWARYAFWQYTAHGNTPGVAGDCDRNQFLGTADELRALGYQGAPATDPPDLDVPAGHVAAIWLAAVWQISERFLANGDPLHQRTGHALQAVVDSHKHHPQGVA